MTTLNEVSPLHPDKSFCTLRRGLVDLKTCTGRFAMAMALRVVELIPRLVTSRRNAFLDLFLVAESISDPLLKIYY